MTILYIFIDVRALLWKFYKGVLSRENKYNKIKVISLFFEFFIIINKKLSMLNLKNEGSGVENYKTDLEIEESLGRYVHDDFTVFYQSSTSICTLLINNVINNGLEWIFKTLCKDCN